MSQLAGLGVGLRLAWRRNRIFYIVWLYALALTLPATAKKYHDLIPAGSDPATLMGTLGNNPTMRALLGPPFDLMTPGGFTFWRVGTFVAAAAAMMAAMGVIRSTRAEEEEGRTELIRSGAVGRAVPLAAGLFLALIMCLATGAVITIAMVVVRTPLAGSVATGLGIGLTGCMWAGVGAICAQVFESARTARYWALGIGLGGLYLLRAMIDGAGDGASVEPLRWAMPFDWAALVRPYAHERWWVLLLPLAFTVVTCVIAFRLDAIRDLGAGLRATKPGPASAKPYLKDAAGLAWRLQRGGVVGWTIGVLVSSVGMGSLALSLTSMLSNNPQIADMFRKMGGDAADLTTSFYQAMLGIMVTIIALCAVVVISRLRQEEAAGRAEVMLSTATSRTRYANSHVLIGAGLAVALLLLTGVLLPAAQAQHDASAHLPWTFFKAALVFLPGLAVVIGLAIALIGWVPRAFGVVWALLGWTILVSWILPLFNLPHWLITLQPWGHLPHLPTDALSWTPILIESALGLGLVALGYAGYRRRDVQGR